MPNKWRYRVTFLSAQCAVLCFTSLLTLGISMVSNLYYIIPPSSSLTSCCFDSEIDLCFGEYMERDNLDNPEWSPYFKAIIKVILRLSEGSLSDKHINSHEDIVVLGRREIHLLLHWSNNSVAIHFITDLGSFTFFFCLYLWSLLWNLFYNSKVHFHTHWLW